MSAILRTGWFRQERQNGTDLLTLNDGKQVVVYEIIMPGGKPFEWGGPVAGYVKQTYQAEEPLSEQWWIEQMQHVRLARQRIAGR